MQVNEQTIQQSELPAPVGHPDSAVSEADVVASSDRLQLPLDAAPPTPSQPEPALKRWQFGLEVTGTEAQSRLIQLGLEKLIEAAGYIGLAAGAQIDVTRQEVPPVAIVLDRVDDAPN